MALSDAQVRSAKARDKNYKLYDADGLFVLVTIAGGKLWRFKCRFAGKEKVMTLGRYPRVGLQEARRKRNAARANGTPHRRIDGQSCTRNRS
jgi:hypothetical protein